MDHPAVSSLHGLFSAFICFNIRLSNHSQHWYSCFAQQALHHFLTAWWCAGILFILVFFSQIGGSPLLSLALCALAGWRAMDFYMGEVAIEVKSSKKLEKETKKARLCHLEVDLPSWSWFAILKLISLNLSHLEVDSLIRWFYECCCWKLFFLSVIFM